MTGRPALRALAFGLALASAAAAPAVVLELEIEARRPVLSGKSFGQAGAYEMIEGEVRFGFDPQSEANARVTDIALAPRNAEGLVEATADFVVVQPVDSFLEPDFDGRRLAVGEVAVHVGHGDA